MDKNSLFQNLRKKGQMRDRSEIRQYRGVKVRFLKEGPDHSMFKGSWDGT